MNKHLPRARQAARALLRQLRVVQPPVDVHFVARALGITLLERPLDDDLSGLAYVSGDKKIIVVNSVHSPNRRRFTIAHEIGHHVLHRDYLERGVHVDKAVLKRDPLSAAGKDYNEIAANHFAAELLMPRSLVALAIPRDFDIIGDEKQLKTLAKKFEVSVSALTIRLATLGEA